MDFGATALRFALGALPRDNDRFALAFSPAVRFSCPVFAVLDLPDRVVSTRPEEISPREGLGLASTPLPTPSSAPIPGMPANASSSATTIRERASRRLTPPPSQEKLR